MKKLIAGNWKMNNTLEQSVALATDVMAGLQANQDLLSGCDFAVFPPHVHLTSVRPALGESVELGAQDCSAFSDGAYTGDISAAMIQDIGCKSVIIGHSERRQYFNESGQLIADKITQAQENGLKVILCVGETDEQRQAGVEQRVIEEQLYEALPSSVNQDNMVIAYEPVWAIGTGKSATIEDISVMHGFIKEKLAERVEGNKNLRILYGGSVKPGNAEEILGLENVDGALIGGASLKAEDFLGIAKAVKG